MHLGRHLVVIIVGLGLAVGLAAPATAAEPAPTTLTLTTPSRYADTATPLRLQLTASEGAPVAGAQVSVERRGSGEWAPLGVVTTDETGRAVLEATLRRDPGDDVFRATYAGDAAYAPATSGPVAVGLVRRDSRLSVGGPDSVVDEQQTTVHVHWTTGNGDPVSGRVKVFRSDRGGEFVLARTLGTDRDGRAELRVRPRADTRWRAQAAALDWVKRGTSDVHSVDTCLRVRRCGFRPRRPAHASRSRRRRVPSASVPTPFSQHFDAAYANGRIQVHDHPACTNAVCE